MFKTLYTKITLVCFFSIIFPVWVSAILRPLTGVWQKHVLQQFGEKPSNVYNKIGELRSLVQEQPHLSSRIEDQFLVSFLRNSKYDVEKAKEKLDSFYAVRDMYPDVFINRNIFKNPKIRDLLQKNTWLLMSEENILRPAVFIGRWGAFDPKQYTLNDACFVGTMSYEIFAWENDDAIISGSWVIFDLANITEAHVAQYSRELIRKYFVINPQMTPIEITGLHFINTTPLSRVAVDIVRDVVDDSLKDKIYEHGSDLTSLYKFVPRDQLPFEYGGTKLSFSQLTKDLIIKFEKYAPFFDLDEKLYGTKENLRKGESPLRKFVIKS